ncbi:hypothetical protein HAX54_013730, partial [Datura stramonium]|nr:hypothetical protein [Datura stramonium]
GDSLSGFLFNDCEADKCGVIIKDVLRRVRSLVSHKNALVEDEQLQKLSMDYPLREHSRTLCRVGISFEEPFDYNNATNEEQARVDSDFESCGDNGDDSERGRNCLCPHR